MRPHSIQMMMLCGYLKVHAGICDRLFAVHWYRSFRVAGGVCFSLGGIGRKRFINPTRARGGRPRWLWVTLLVSRWFLAHRQDCVKVSLHLAAETLSHLHAVKFLPQLAITASTLLQLFASKDTALVCRSVRCALLHSSSALCLFVTFALGYKTVRVKTQEIARQPGFSLRRNVEWRRSLQQMYLEEGR